MTAIVENWRIAVGSLRANWFRALLTALGVVIGVASLIAVSAVSAGAQADVAASIDRLGGNVIKVDGEVITSGARTTSDRTITPEDVDAVGKLPSVTAVAPHQDIESLTVSAGRHKTATWLVGQTAEYSVIQNQRVSWGRTISAGDVAYGRSVMVLGTVPRKKLFPGETAIGKTVRVGSQEFEVIGIQARRGKLADENLDNRIFVPLPLVTGVLVGGGPNVVHLDILVDSPGAISPTIDATESLLGDQHNLPAGSPEDFTVEDQASIVKEGQRATTTFRILTFALGGIALLVGGIGIMNMMLVSVHERTREIGIRKSVGATPWKVQAQFLIEAIILSTLGGVAGILAGLGVSRLVNVFAGWQTIVSNSSVLLSFLVALGVGLFFGYYPARRAARLDPITALRFE